MQFNFIYNNIFANEILLNVNMFNAKMLNEIFNERNDFLIISINNDNYQKINWLWRKKIENYKNFNDDKSNKINLF